MTDQTTATPPRTLDDHVRALQQKVLVAPVEEVVALADQALADFPRAAQVLMFRGLAKERGGDRYAALVDLEAAAKLASEGDQEHIKRICHQNLGSILVDARNPKKALEHLKVAASLGDPGHTLLAGVGRAYAHLGDLKNSSEWGQRALEARDVLHPLGNAAPAARQRPRPFDPGKRKRNIISYCLFGQNQYYFDCAIANAWNAAAAFTDFTARFYCAPDTPKDVLKALAQTGANVRVVQKVNTPWDGLFWRFWAFDDPDVDVVLIRDVDSPLIPRERLAIEDWLHNSDAPFHVMRDHVLHCEPMMAGLWGGFTGLLPKLAPICSAYLAKRSFRYADQDFLRQIVWPRIREATLAHDKCFSLRETRQFSESGRAYGPMHVGWAWPRPDRYSRAAI